VPTHWTRTKYGYLIQYEWDIDWLVKGNNRRSGYHGINVGFEEIYDSSSFDFDAFLEIPNLEISES